jgi:leucyl aminopeptidase
VSLSLLKKIPLINSEDTPAKWMAEADKEALLRAGVKYMDITDYPESAAFSAQHSAWTPCK